MEYQFQDKPMDSKVNSLRINLEENTVLLIKYKYYIANDIEKDVEEKHDIEINEINDKYLDELPLNKEQKNSIKNILMRLNKRSKKTNSNKSFTSITMEEKSNKIVKTENTTKKVHEANGGVNKIDKSQNTQEQPKKIKRSQSTNDLNNVNKNFSSALDFFKNLEKSSKDFNEQIMPQRSKSAPL